MGAYKKLWNNEIILMNNRKVLSQQLATKKRLEEDLKEAEKKQGNWDEEKELKKKLADQTNEIEGNKELKKVGTKQRIEVLEVSIRNLHLEIESIKQL